MKCKKHPKYGTKRPPLADCDRCWRMWLSRIVEDLTEDLERAQEDLRYADEEGWVRAIR